MSKKNQVPPPSPLDLDENIIADVLHLEHQLQIARREQLRTTLHQPRVLDFVSYDQENGALTIHAGQCTRIFDQDLASVKVTVSLADPEPGEQIVVMSKLDAEAVIVFAAGTEERGTVLSFLSPTWHYQIPVTTLSEISTLKSS
jgi:hypothetical protein